ncbi:hypothetical protein DYB30_012276 [Aphanomyces astaci]|uniref:Uncharacterized protein n=2 Tax=Aphanomyces astaci TaxID=112090 RepID=A0A397E486_APHAT|nr:hypothetical protein DYB30_012276 [Aphanomyces astaci]
MFRNVSFRTLRETQIHKNDKKLLAFYADCQDFMLSGVVTEVRYVVGSENDPDIDTPGKKTKTEAKAMVALYKITWNHTRFQRDEPWITARLFYKVPAHVCPHAAWSCWDKFHSFYHPKGLFKKDGKMDRGSELYRLKKHGVMEHKARSAKKTLIFL